VHDANSITVSLLCLFSFSSSIPSKTDVAEEGEFDSFLFFVITSSVEERFEVERSSVSGLLIGVVGPVAAVEDRNIL
jgi:hypothetical protein